MSHAPQPDLEHLRGELAPLEALAAELPWAHERPWRVASHVRPEGDLIQVDLHDLNARCARRAVRLVEQAIPGLHTGAVGFITGVGSHSIGPGVLTDVVARELRKIAPRHGWAYQPNGRGAVVLIWDPARAPAIASGQLPALFWLVAAVMLAALAAIEPYTTVPMAVVAVVVLVRWWVRRARRKEQP
jgi:hypothetical protein